RVRFARVAPTGTVLDAPSVEAYSRKQRNNQYLSLAGVGFDGTDYWLGTLDTRFGGAGRTTFYVMRVHADGSFGKRVRVAALSTLVNAVFGCRPGGCLFAWLDDKVEAVEVTGKYVRSGWALALHGDRAVSAPKRVVRDMFGFTGLATDGQNFFGLS